MARLLQFWTIENKPILINLNAIVYAQRRSDDTTSVWMSNTTILDLNITYERFATRMQVGAA